MRQAPDDQMPVLNGFCQTMGPGVIVPLVGALATEESRLAVRRVKDVLIGFGEAAREPAKTLRDSTNPAVRRAAIEVLRAVGGAGALGDLRSLLADPDPNVQREALRAIIQIGSDEAYAVLEEALTSGEPRAREAVMHTLGSITDERAAPLLVHILSHSPYTGRRGVHLHVADRCARAQRSGDAGHRYAEATALPRRMVGADAHGPDPGGRGARPARGRHCRGRCPARGSQHDRVPRRPPRGRTRHDVAAPVPAGRRDPVMEPARQLRVADDFVRRFAAAVRGAQLYSPGHPLVTRALAALVESCSQLLADEASVAVGIVGQDIVVGDLPIPRSRDTYGELIRRLKRLGIERIAFERGVPPDELSTLVQTISHPERLAGQATVGARPSDALEALSGLQRIRVGRIQIDERVDTSAADIAAIRRLYVEASTVAEEVWDAAQHEGTPDPRAARTLIEQLSQAVAQNRTALLALTALKEYDNYTFTHMVNVSILTMAQARALGIDGTLLREFGLAGLMHDIGKVRTPAEILRKPDRLTPAEMSVMRRHVVDGAEILRRTPEIPSIAPVVAFEHHLRSDGTGYPVGVSRAKLNLATMLCSIADVYDAMRSQRAYQGSLPTQRILEVMKQADGHQFDQHLVRRFTQLLGIYPPGNLVLLDDGAIAVVLQVHAPDPHRPRVRVIMDSKRRRLVTPIDINLFEEQADPTKSRRIVTPLDPAEYGVDPLGYL